MICTPQNYLHQKDKFVEVRILNSFSFWSPTKVVFGEGTVPQTGSEVKAFGGSRVLVLYGGGSVVKSGLLDKVSQSLKDEGLEYFCVGGVQPNPLLDFALKIIADYKDKNIDFILAVGGGSTIDTAKAVATGLVSDEVPLWDYFLRKTVPTKAVPVGVVLTIAAAGSETSDSCVVTNKEINSKRGFNSQTNRPKFAIMDPVLTYSLPPFQVACGIVDMLMHTLDRYFAPETDNAVTDEIAEGLMRVVIKYGKIAMEKPTDYKARSEIMWAGALTHNGISGLGQPLDFAVHQLGHPLSAKYDAAHGVSLSVTWASWARYVYTHDLARFAKFAREVLGISEADDGTAAINGINTTEEFFRSIGMPVTLSEAIGESVSGDIDELAEMCSFGRTRTIGSFKALNHDDIRAIYQAAL